MLMWFFFISFLKKNPLSLSAAVAIRFKEGRRTCYLLAFASLPSERQIVDRLRALGWDSPENSVLYFKTASRAYVPVVDGELSWPDYARHASGAYTLRAQEHTPDPSPDPSPEKQQKPPEMTSVDAITSELAQTSLSGTSAVVPPRVTLYMPDSGQAVPVPPAALESWLKRGRRRRLPLLVRVFLA